MKKFVGNYEYDMDDCSVFCVVGILAPDEDEAKEVLLDYLCGRYGEAVSTRVTNIREDEAFFDANLGLTILRAR